MVLISVQYYHTFCSHVSALLVEKYIYLLPINVKSEYTLGVNVKLYSDFETVTCGLTMRIISILLAKEASYLTLSLQTYAFANGVGADQAAPSEGLTLFG